MPKRKALRAQRQNAMQVTIIGYAHDGQVVEHIGVFHCDNHTEPELIFVFHPERSGHLKGEILQTRPANVWERQLGCMACRRRQRAPFLWTLGAEFGWDWDAVERDFAVWAAKYGITPTTLIDDDGGGYPESGHDFSYLTPAQLPRHIERPLTDDEP